MVIIYLLTVKDGNETIDTCAYSTLGSAKMKADAINAARRNDDAQPLDWEQTPWGTLEADDDCAYTIEEVKLDA